MKTLIQLFLIYSIVANGSLFAQLDSPDVQAVYGGRINAITGYARTADTTRVFVSTESANSIFYGDVAATATPPEFGTFTVMPGVDGSAGYGAWIHNIAVHDSSGTLFFIHQSGLLSSHPNSTSVDTIQAGNFHTLMIHENTLYYINEIHMFWGELDASGNFSEDVDSPMSYTSVGFPKHIRINPIDSLVYVLTGDNTPLLHVSSNKFSELDAASIFTDISPTSLSTAIDWFAFGIGPDGRLLIGGSDPNSKYFAYSDDAVTWTSYATGIGGISGPNIAVSGDPAAYYVYFASSYNSNKGESGAWHGFGQPGGFETHSNDGSVFADPVNANIVYMTTDQGLGTSTDQGATIFEINNGIEAVQVNDFDMTADKNIGWLASKSGIRRVNDFLTSPTWSNAMFPMGDGSPYHSVDMVPGDSLTVYAGNVRIYKTTNNGASWTQVFTPENAPYNFSNFGTQASAIEVCPYDSTIVFAGFEAQGLNKGGLFHSADEGVTWDQLLLEASTDGEDVDVFDIVFNVEGTDTVAYVGAEYDLDDPQGRSVYKVTKSGSSWNAAQDMDGGTTTSGSPIVVTIRDLEVSVTGDTIYACGTDAGVNHPTAYWKPLNAGGLWSSMGVSGFPMSEQEGMAITVGRDTVYCAVENEIYFRPVAASSWSLGYAYPEGTRINVLYFDDLLAGTDTGLYDHSGGGLATHVDNPRRGAVPEGFALEQNYPNPFNPTTVISYSLALNRKVLVTVHNLLGAKVAVLVDERQHAGSHQVHFDASNLPNGVYFYTISAGGFKATQKMLLLK